MKILNTVFKRTGGVSINEFSSLNCKYSFDTISKINSNRAIVSNLMGIKILISLLLNKCIPQM